MDAILYDAGTFPDSSVLSLNGHVNKWLDHLTDEQNIDGSSQALSS